jgi:8-oxo-dGTP diphosphatase
MSKERFKIHAAVFLLLIKDRKILLLRRFNTGWQDGNYSFPAGHLDGEEKVTDALIREVKEETSIELAPEHVHVVHVMHRRSLDREYIDFFLIADDWHGEPAIMEPDKCNDLSWFSLDQLPDNLLKFARHAIECYRKGVTFSEFGWRDGEAE